MSLGRYAWHLGSAPGRVKDAERHDLRYRFELVGESIREVGVLLLVFVPLDAIFSQGQFKLQTIIGLAILAVAGFALIVVGVRIEGRK